jgi:hypothetical protein
VADTNNDTIRACGVNLSLPVITAQPQSQSVNAGQSATFSVTATGSPPLAYQWLYFYPHSALSKQIPGATGSSYTVANVESGDAGGYAVSVSNSSGTVQSNITTLMVNSAGLPSNGAVGLPSNGGGGAPSWWFILGLALIGIWRLKAWRRLPEERVG